MFPSDLQTWIIYIVLALVLGALGNGLWEAAFKPFFSLSGRVLLRASTFGFTVARDSIYKEIARRTTNRPALFILGLATFVFVYQLGVASVNYDRANISREDAIAAKLAEEKELETLKTLPPEEQQKKLRRPGQDFVI